MTEKAERGSTESFLSSIDEYNSNIEEEMIEKICKEIVAECAGVSVPEDINVQDHCNAQEADDGNEVLVAFDAVALYPSIGKEVATSMCKQAALETEIEMKHMNQLEATRLLVLTWSSEKTASSNLRKFLPVHS